MASSAPITGAFTRPFQNGINGVSFSYSQVAEDLLAQAHGIACCISVVSERGDMSGEICAAAARAVTTLIEQAAAAMSQGVLQ